MAMRAGRSWLRSGRCEGRRERLERRRTGLVAALRLPGFVTGCFEQRHVRVAGKSAVVHDRIRRPLTATRGHAREHHSIQEERR
jgi:hypothetical protein